MSKTFWFVVVPVFLSYMLITGDWPGTFGIIPITIISLVLTSIVDVFLIAQDKLSVKCSVCNTALKLSQDGSTRVFCPTCNDTVDTIPEK